MSSTTRIEADTLADLGRRTRESCSRNLLVWVQVLPVAGELPWQRLDLGLMLPPARIEVANREETSMTNYVTQRDGV